MGRFAREEMDFDLLSIYSSKKSVALLFGVSAEFFNLFLVHGTF
jgi:hypothetical protein